MYHAVCLPKLCLNYDDKCDTNNFLKNSNNKQYHTISSSETHALSEIEKIYQFLQDLHNLQRLIKKETQNKYGKYRFQADSKTPN